MKNQRLFLILALLLVWSVTEACDTDIGTTSGNPAKSCKQVYECNPNSLTGYYYMQTKHGHSIVTRQVHCEMNVNRCGIKGGWTRVANIRGGSPCPRDWQEIRADGWKRLCVKQEQLREAGCSSTHFSTFGIEYNHICGMAKGYQFGSPDAFGPSINNINPHPSINNKVYVDGLSITHGSPRKHVWTYAASFAEGDSTYKANCPCGSSTEGYKPDFVSDHYYCESGSNTNTPVVSNPKWYLRDPLWDGFGCRSDSSCCSSSGMPWFCRTLTVNVKDDIEGRLCTNEGTDTENMGIEDLEIYIQ